MREPLLILALAVSHALLGWALATSKAADEPEPAGGQATEGGLPKFVDAKRGEAPRYWTTAVDPKPLSPNVRMGLDWLAKQQLASGGWGQGEESAEMGGGELRDAANVADTCIAALALIRSGSTPREGPYQDAIVRAVRFVRMQVEASDARSLSVTRVQGTRVQEKLGPNIDTFLAAMLLAEVKGRMPEDVNERRMAVDLNKVIDKIQRHQKADGSFEGAGWAPILAQAMCGKGINRARQAGNRVSDTVLARAENAAKRAFAESNRPGSVTRSYSYSRSSSGSRSIVSRRSGSISVRSSGMMGGRGPMMGGMGSMGGAAGVELYEWAASVGVLQDSVNTGKLTEMELRGRASYGKNAKGRNEAKARLAQIADIQKVREQALAAVIERLEDPGFVAGFGSNGGEEFLSYMTLSESLVLKGGEAWKKWDARMTQNLERVQNGDGSWSGHHCITGRTFCTATALLVLMADRTPVPFRSMADSK